MKGNIFMYCLEMRATLSPVPLVQMLSSLSDMEDFHCTVVIEDWNTRPLAYKWISLTDPVDNKYNHIRSTTTVKALTAG